MNKNLQQPGGLIVAQLGSIVRSEMFLSGKIVELTVGLINILVAVDPFYWLPGGKKQVHFRVNTSFEMFLQHIGCRLRVVDL